MWEETAVKNNQCDFFFCYVACSKEVVYFMSDHPKEEN